MNRRDLFRGASSMALAAAAPAKGFLDKHRNLFTGDSCVYFYNPEIFHPEGLPYTAKAIHRYVDLLAASGVDTFLSNPNAQVAWYPSKKLETILDGYKRGDREFFRAHGKAARVPGDEMEAYLDQMVKFQNLYLDLVEGGVDWLRETVKACRRNKIAAWVSIRMNDTHGALEPTSYFNCKLFKDPVNRLAGRQADPRDANYSKWMALNYGRKQVRDFMMAHIVESIDDYGFDGLELDWLRDPHILEPGASEADCRMMTAWIREIRAVTARRARITGKPVPLGMRIPANLGYLRSRGLDVRAIAQEGLVDFVGFSNYWQTTWDLPYDQLRAEIGPHVAIYGVVEDAPNWIQGYSSLPEVKPSLRYLSASAPMLRANAAGKLVMGVHGIEQFNFFCSDQPKIPGMRGDYDALRNIHNLEFLRGKPKHYCLASPSGHLTMLWETPEQVPAVIDSRNRREFRLSMCAEPPAARLFAQVVIEKPAAAVRLGVSFNGAWPTYESRETREMLFPSGALTQFSDTLTAWEFPLDAAMIRDGFNTLTVLNNTKTPPAAVKVMSVELAIKS